MAVYKKQKQIQRKVNKVIKDIQENLNDTFENRYTIKQIDRRCISDFIVVKIQFLDSLNNIIYVDWFKSTEILLFTNKIYIILNDFIINCEHGEL